MDDETLRILSELSELSELIELLIPQIPSSTEGGGFEPLRVDQDNVYGLIQGSVTSVL